MNIGREWWYGALGPIFQGLAARLVGCSLSNVYPDAAVFFKRSLVSSLTDADQAGSVDSHDTSSGVVRVGSHVGKHYWAKQGYSVTNTVGTM